MIINRGKRTAGVLAALFLLGCAPLARAGDNMDSPVFTATEKTPKNLNVKKDVTMKSRTGFVQNIEAAATENQDFRRVLYTSKHCQLVVMALKPKEEIGMEVHDDADQFLRVEQGTGEAVLDGVRTPISAGSAILVPSGTKHNILNTGTTPMKLYTLYAPPHHRDGVVHHTRAEAEKDQEHFDGKTTQ